MSVKSLVLALFVAGGAVALNAVDASAAPITLAQYNFNTFASGLAVQSQPTTTAANVVVTSVLAGGGASVVDDSSGSGSHGLKLRDVETSTNVTDAIANNDYFKFTITPAAGYTLNLASLSLYVANPASTPRGYAVRSSLDGYAANLFGSTFNSFGNASPSATLTATSLTSTIEFRVYGFLPSSPDPARGLVFDNITISGEVNAVPEPTTMGLIGVAGAMAMRRVRRDV